MPRGLISFVVDLQSSRYPVQVCNGSDSQSPDAYGCYLHEHSTVVSHEGPAIDALFRAFEQFID